MSNKESTFQDKSDADVLARIVLKNIKSIQDVLVGDEAAIRFLQAIVHNITFQNKALFSNGAKVSEEKDRKWLQ